MPPVSSLLDRVLTTVTRALGGRPGRVATIRVGTPLDLRGTTAYDPKAERASRASRLAGAFVDPWAQSRLQRIRDYREMVEEMPELARSLEVTVDLTFGDSEVAYEVIYAEDAREEVRRVIEATEAALGLQVEIKRIIHEGLWLGDSFSELVYGDAPLRLVGERSWRPEQVTVVQGEGGFLTGYNVQVEGREEPRPLSPFQVIHYAPNAVRGARYGRSMFHSARYLRRHHDVFTDVTAMLCLRRASGDTYFLWPMPEELDETAQNDYIRKLQASIDHEVFFESDGTLRRRAAAHLDTVPKMMPYRVLTSDDGTPTEVKPTAIETKPADLRQMVEVLRYLQDRAFIATGVPKALVGLERDVNARATLEVQGLHFAITVHTRQREAAGLLTDFFNRALLVEGIVPEPGEYAVRMPDSSTFDEQLRAGIFQTRASGVLSLVQAGVPLRQALKEGFSYDEETLDALQDAIDSGPAAVIAAIEHAATKGLRVVVEGTERLHRPENRPA